MSLGTAPVGTGAVPWLRPFTAYRQCDQQKGGTSVMYLIEFDCNEVYDLWSEEIVEADGLVTAVTAAQRMAHTRRLPVGCQLSVGEHIPASFNWQNDKHGVRGARTLIVWEGSLKEWNWADDQSLRDWAKDSIDLYRGTPLGEC